MVWQGEDIGAYWGEAMSRTVMTGSTNLDSGDTRHLEFGS